MKKIKRIIPFIMTATLLFSSITVNAAPTITAKQNAEYMMSTNADGAPNWFSGNYYSDKYADLKIAFNDNEKLLYKHGLNYGFKEARLVTPVLDVVKYRAFYPDLDKAFGDNWKLYVRHYFEYGINEGRENFTNFDAKTYLSMHPDLQNVFGDDLGLATRHYIEYGITEGRAYKWPEVVVEDEDLSDTNTSDDNDDNSNGNDYTDDNDSTNDSSSDNKDTDDNDSTNDSSSDNKDTDDNDSTNDNSSDNKDTDDNDSTDDSSSDDEDTDTKPFTGDKRTDYDNGSYIITTYEDDVKTAEKLYDATGNLTKEITYYKSGNPKVETHYASDGTTIRLQIFYNEDGSVNGPVSFDNITITDKTNTTFPATLYTSEEAATKYFLQNVFDGSTAFGILVEDLSMLHTVKEYMELSKILLNLEISDITKYDNGYYLEFENIKTYKVDTNVIYAMRTGDTSFLVESEHNAYNKMYSVVEELKLDEMANDIDKIIAIHDYIVLNTAYDEDTADGLTNNEYAHSFEGVFNDGKAVCEGYASAFRLLCETQGIPCEYVWSDAGNHGWNLVQLNNQWYHIDITWDDPVPDKEGRSIYSYFMMTDEEVKELDQHMDWECECQSPENHNCDDTTYRIYPYQAYFCKTEAEAQAVIEAQASKGEIIIVYPSDSTELTEEYLLDLVMATFQSGIYYSIASLGRYNIINCIKMN